MNTSNFILMEPSNQSFKDMMGNGTKYNVPRFQRDYSWELEHLEDLWSDIEYLKDDESHYMGYLVLQKTDRSSFEIIDGQQRLTTISLFILSAMQKLQDFIDKDIDHDDNNERLNILRDTYIGVKSPISLQVDGKLTLNRNNQYNYKHISSTLSIKNERNLTRTKKLLNDAFSFFRKKEFGKNGLEVMKLVDKVTHALIFTKIVVEDTLNAFKVFETLNSRGVSLSTSDLLKNYIFSKIATDNTSNEDLDLLDERWGAIIEQLGENNFTDFLRYHHNIAHKVITKKNLFKSTREYVGNSKEAYKYLGEIEKFAPIYYALQYPEDAFWSTQDEVYRDCKSHLSALKLFGIKQPLVILMITFDTFSAEEFVKVVEYIYKFSIRYNVICHHSPNELEGLYSLLARKVISGELKRASSIKNSLEFQKLYPSDGSFKNIFEYYKMPSKSSAVKIRFILSEIENYLGASMDYKKVNLEHICPYNPTQEWHKEFGENINETKDRLGNFLLLATDSLGGKSFNDKKTYYSKESSQLSKKIMEYETWNIENLNDYQSWLAEQGVKVWGIG